MFRVYSMRALCVIYISISGARSSEIGVYIKYFFSEYTLYTLNIQCKGQYNPDGTFVFSTGSILNILTSTLYNNYASRILNQNNNIYLYVLLLLKISYLLTIVRKKNISPSKQGPHLQ